MREHPPSIAVLVDTATTWGRRVIRGVTNYSRKSGPWHLVVESRGPDGPTRPPEGWSGDGIIARVASHETRDALIETGLPVVNVSNLPLEGAAFPRVAIDCDAVAALAAAHLVERNFRTFGYVGSTACGWAQRQAEAFNRALEHDGHPPCRVFDYNRHHDDPRLWLEVERELIAWLDDLPKPTGVFAWSLEAGARVLDACRRQGIAVPLEVAVLCDQDDPLLCDTTTPPMSAIGSASEALGYLAATRLDGLIRGGPAPLGLQTVAPVDVTLRGSTDAYAVDDPEMVRAITYIRLNIHEPFSIDDVADAVPVGRRSLERKFREAFGRSPLEEIRRARIRRARELLTTTDLPISQVADRCGFSSPEYLTHVFRKVTGLSPLKYRMQVQGR